MEFDISTGPLKNRFRRGFPRIWRINALRGEVLNLSKFRELGLPRKQAAALLKIDEGTLKHYEDGLWEPGERNRTIIERFLAKRP